MPAVQNGEARDVVPPVGALEVTILAQIDVVSGQERRRLGPVRPPRVDGDASLPQTVHLGVSIRHFSTLGRTLGSNYARYGCTYSTEYMRRLQACIHLSETALRVSNKTTRAIPRVREGTRGDLLHRVGYIRSSF